MRPQGWLRRVLEEAREMADRIPPYRRGDDVQRELRRLEAGP